MPLYRLNFAASEEGLYPKLADMQTVEVEIPLAAVEVLLRERNRPRGRLVGWARVVIESVDGKPILNFRFSNVSLVPEMRQPIDVLINGHLILPSRSDRI